MRILFAALGSPGHAFPLVPLALALRDAGHDVTFAVGTDTAEAIASTGLEVVVTGPPLGAAFGPVLARRGLTERPTDQEVMRSMATEVFGSVLPRAGAERLVPWVAEHRPDLVVAEVAEAGAALAAGAAGVPCVLHAFGRRPPAEAPMGARVRGPLLEIAADHGVTLQEGQPLGHAYLDICPPSLQAPATGDEGPEFPLRPTAWNPPVPSSPTPDGPWVYLTLGTAMGDAEVLRTAVGGLSRLGLDVLVSTGSVDAGELADVGSGGTVRVEPFVAQADLFASATPPRLVVHHGGSGTTLAAAAAGIPQLFVPQGADQFINAGAVTAVGAGATLPRTPDAEAVAEAARALLADGAERASARALAGEVAAMPSPAEVAARVDDWAWAPQPLM